MMDELYYKQSTHYSNVIAFCPVKYYFSVVFFRAVLDVSSETVRTLLYGIDCTGRHE